MEVNMKETVTYVTCVITIKYISARGVLINFTNDILAQNAASDHQARIYARSVNRCMCNNMSSYNLSHSLSSCNTHFSGKLFPMFILFVSSEATL